VSDSITFNYTGKVVTFTAPATGLYDITAIGASGGNGQGTVGGVGADVSGEVELTAGEVLSIAVGGAGAAGTGTDGAGGGGGASFVVGPDDAPLVIAGGGGGAAEDGNGGNGGALATSGGSGGNGGSAIGSINAGGGGGGGLQGDGAHGVAGDDTLGGFGGRSFVNGAAGGSGGFLSGAGGFGGGGGGGETGGGGGGGGYSGGDGGSGNEGLNDGLPGVAGTSFDSGTNPQVSIAPSVGNGSVTIAVVTAVDHPPTLTRPTLTLSPGVTEGPTLQGLYAQLLANAQDVDSGDQSKLTISAIGQSSTMGFLYFDLADQRLTYTADGFNPKQPTDSFTYTVSDPQGATVTGTVNVPIIGPNLPTHTGGPGADTLTATGRGQRLIGGAGNDRLTAHGSGSLLFAGAGDDTITADGDNATIYGGTGTNRISLHGARQTIVLQQGGTDQIRGFTPASGDVLDLRQVLAESRVNLGGDFGKLGSYVAVTDLGSDAALSFGGVTLAVMHGVGPNTTLATLIGDHALAIT